MGNPWIIYGLWFGLWLDVVPGLSIDYALDYCWIMAGPFVDYTLLIIHR